MENESGEGEDADEDEDGAWRRGWLMRCARSREAEGAGVASACAISFVFCGVVACWSGLLCACFRDFLFGGVVVCCCCVVRWSAVCLFQSVRFVSYLLNGGCAPASHDDS